MIYGKVCFSLLSSLTWVTRCSCCVFTIIINITSPSFCHSFWHPNENYISGVLAISTTSTSTKHSPAAAAAGCNNTLHPSHVIRGNRSWYYNELRYTNHTTRQPKPKWYTEKCICQGNCFCAANLLLVHNYKPMKPLNRLGLVWCVIISSITRLGSV